ncbi:hypothetical protein DF057_18825 [Burkholderia cepacia]|nr:hypothetical protein DF057_18825 [Burkholderia cepacia]
MRAQPTPSRRTATDSPPANDLRVCARASRPRVFFRRCRARYAIVFSNDGRIATEGNVVIVNVAGRTAIGTIDFTGYHEPPRPRVVPVWQARTRS